MSGGTGGVVGSAGAGAGAGEEYRENTGARVPLWRAGPRTPVGGWRRGARALGESDEQRGRARIDGGREPVAASQAAGSREVPEARGQGIGRGRAKCRCTPGRSSDLPGEFVAYGFVLVACLGLLHGAELAQRLDLIGADGDPLPLACVHLVHPQLLLPAPGRPRQPGHAARTTPRERAIRRSSERAANTERAVSQRGCPPHPYGQEHQAVVSQGRVAASARYEALQATCVCTGVTGCRR